MQSAYSCTDQENRIKAKVFLDKNKTYVQGVCRPLSTNVGALDFPRECTCIEDGTTYWEINERCT